MGTLSFTNVKGLRPKKNRFNKSYLKAFPSTMGKLVPVHTDFIIPGSWVEMKSSLFTRTQALVAPVMDNISTYVHYWKIPIRLLDKKFTKFIGGEIKPEEYNPAYFVPMNLINYYSQIAVAGSGWSLLSEFLSLPFGEEIASKIKINPSAPNSLYFSEFFTDGDSANSTLMDLLGYLGDGGMYQGPGKGYTGVINLFEFKSYLLLLKVWYTNENITLHFPIYAATRGNDYTQEGDTLPEVIEDFLDLEGNISSYFGALYIDMLGNFGDKALFNHAWAKDYFTSALPNTQFGEEVKIPLGTDVPVVGNISAGNSFIGDSDGIKVGATNGITTNQNVNVTPVSGVGSGKLVAGESSINQLSGSRAQLNNVQGLHADLSEAAAISILELRIAETLQVYKERIIRAGRKYREYLKMFFNVTSSDARLQDPEWLGGGKVALQVGDIEQTSATDSVSPQGNLAGKGTQFGANFAGFKTWCEEWCIIIGVAYMQPKARYCQGIERNKLKTNDLYDWFNPTFERIGEQPIKMVELYSGNGVSEDDIFGYQRRYAEYTFKNDQMHGAFKNSLSFWTAGLRIFDSKPALNQQFIYVQPGVFDRIFAVAESENDGNVLFWWQHAYFVKQPVSKFGTPGLHLY